MDIFSYALEEPVRLDFFGDTIDSIRTFDVTTQLSHEKCHSVTVATRVHSPGEAMRSFWSLLPDDTILMTRNARYVYDVVTETYATGFSSSNSEEGDVMSAADENDGSSEVANDLMLYNASDWETQTRRFRQVHLCSRPTDADGLSLSFKTQMQPLFQKNMELMASSFKRFREKGYDLYIMAADEVQHDRIRDILDGMLCPVSFIPVSDTLHAGFCDDTLKVCFYTDHQIFDRPHRYSLRSERVRGGKTTLALRDLREFEAGDYVVHIDHGIGRFEGLVRVAVGDSEQEAMKIVYGGGDVVYVSIHQLSKVSKYRSQDTDSPRLSRLGSGPWNALKERTKKRIKDTWRIGIAKLLPFLTYLAPLLVLFAICLLEVFDDKHLVIVTNMLVSFYRYGSVLNLAPYMVKIFPVGNFGYLIFFSLNNLLCDFELILEILEIYLFSCLRICLLLILNRQILLIYRFLNFYF